MVDKRAGPTTQGWRHRHPRRPHWAGVILKHLTSLDRRLVRRLETIMAGTQEVRDAVASVKADLAALGARVDEDVAELKRLIAAGSTPEEMQPIVDELTSVSTAMKAIDPLPDFPAPPPPPSSRR